MTALAKLLKEATGRPWHRQTGEPGTSVVAGALCVAGCGSGNLARDNARLIALAVNNVEALVELAEQFESFCDDGTPDEAVSPEEASLRKNARALLARIEKEAAHA